MWPVRASSCSIPPWVCARAGGCAHRSCPGGCASKAGCCSCELRGWIGVNSASTRRSNRGAPGAYRDGIVDSNGGCACVAARTRAKVRSGTVTRAKRLTEHFEAGTVKRIRARAPHACSELDKVYRARRSANLKTCKQCCNAFLRGMHFRHHGGRDRRQSASAASESVLGLGIPVLCGECLFRNRILGPATGPSDRSRA